MCQRLLQIFCFHIPQKWIDLSKPLRKQLPGSLAAIYTFPPGTSSNVLSSGICQHIMYCMGGHV